MSQDRAWLLARRDRLCDFSLLYAMASHCVKGVEVMKLRRGSRV